MMKRMQRVYSFPFGIFTYSLLLISFFGIIDSFLDTNRTRLFVYLPLITPAILASGYYLSIAFENHVTTKEFTTRFYYSFFIITLPFILMECIIALLVYNYFAWKDLVYDSGWWHEGFAFIFIISIFIMIFVQWLGVLFIGLIIAIPIIAFKKPHVLLQDSVILLVEDKNMQNKLVRILFIGLSSCVVGVILTKTLGHLFDFTNWSLLLLQGRISLPFIGWLFGWVCLVFAAICFGIFIIQLWIHSK